MRQQFLNTPDDCQWLKDVHLKEVDHPSFKSFMLYGNEDAPQRVELYTHEEPRFDDTFHTVTFWEN